MTFEDHMEHLFDALCRISRANMSIGASKCAIGMPEVPYLGYIVTREGLKPNPKRASAISEIKWPNTTKRWQSFLETANTYRRFIKNHARIAKPIQDLINNCSARRGKYPTSRERAPKEVVDSFDKIIEEITNEPILAHPDFTKPFTIETDGAMDGLGAVLTQVQDGQTRVIMFCSRSLKPAEKNYTPYERECLALVWATDVLRPYLLGAHFNVITDNVAVSGGFADKKKNQPQNRGEAEDIGHRSETEVLKQAGARIVPVTPDSRQPCDKKPESEIGFLVSGYGRGRAPETEKAALVA